MSDYKKWKGKDSDYTLEEQADMIASRLRWDEQVKEYQKMGLWWWNDHVPFDPTATEDVFNSIAEEKGNG